MVWSDVCWCYYLLCRLIFIWCEGMFVLVQVIFWSSYERKMYRSFVPHLIWHKIYEHFWVTADMVFITANHYLALVCYQFLHFDHPYSGTVFCLVVLFSWAGTAYWNASASSLRLEIPGAYAFSIFHYVLRLKLLLRRLGNLRIYILCPWLFRNIWNFKVGRLLYT